MSSSFKNFVWDIALFLVYLQKPKEWLASNFSLQYHPWIKHEGHKNEENDHQLNMVLIIKQILSVSTLGNI